MTSAVLSPHPVHLLVVGLSWPMETFIRALLQGLLKAGFSITVATTRRPDEAWTRGDRFHWLSTASWHGPLPLRMVRWAYVLAGAALRSPRSVATIAEVTGAPRGGLARWEAFYELLPFSGRRFDLIYFPWNGAAIDYLGLFELGRPVIISCRGSQIHVAPHDPNRRPLREGLKETFRRAAAVHCVSDSIKREAVGYGLDESKAHVIRPAVDVARFLPRVGSFSSEGRLRLLSVGSLVWVKGHEYAIRSVAMLRQQGVPVSLDILGEGADRQRLLYTIHDLGLSDKVRLRGKVSPEEVRARMQEADVFLLPSLSEGISNAALEAMASGLPVVTTDCGGMREVITDGLEGFVVPVRSPREMASGVATLWREPQLRRTMGEAARARVLTSHDLDSQVAHFAELCRAVADPRR